MAADKNKLHQKAKERVFQLLSQDMGLDKIVPIIKSEFGKDITIQAVSYYNVKYRDKIDEMRLDYYQSEVFRQPIAHRGYRLKELQKIYDKAEDNKTAIAALRAACAEMGENYDKIADALRNRSTGDTHIHFYDIKHIESLPDHELERIARNNQAVLNRLDSRVVSNN